MKIIRAERGQGKTTELIKRSNKEWKYIVCVDRGRVDNIVRMAQHMGLDIPYPLTVRELPLKQGQRIKSVLIDEVDDVLEYLIGRPVDCVTTSCEIEILKDWRSEKVKFKICNGRYDDFLIIEGETIEEIREKVANESNSRGWKDEDCWSEEVKD